MTKIIKQAGPEKTTGFTGNEAIELQDGDGFGSSKWASLSNILAALVVIPAPLVTSVQGRQGAVV